MAAAATHVPVHAFPPVHAMPPTINTSPLVGYSGSQTRYVLVRDISNGYDLYTKNPDTTFDSFASMTKMMTTLLIMEYKSSVLDSESVTLTVDDVAQPYPPLTESSAGFLAGDVTTYRGLLYGILLPSGFEPCQCAARLIGDYIYAQAGNTGTQGRTRFIERMNSRAAELGMTNTTFYDAFGNGNGISTSQNVSTARDLSTVCYQMMVYTAVRSIAATPTYGLTVTGSNPRTITMTMYNRFVNGPTLNQSGISDTNVVGGKNGEWDAAGQHHHSAAVVWRSPNNTEVLFTVLNAESLFAVMLDIRALMYTAVKDFPYLDDGAIPGDPNFASVKLLVGFDGSTVDESTVGRALVNNSVSIGTQVIYNAVAGSGGGVFNSQGDYVTAADASDLRVGSGDMTVEGWYAGDGTNLPGEFVFFCKAEHTPSVNREYLAEVFAGDIEIFASSDGSTWTNSVVYSLSGAEQATLFNGAPRHVAIVKSGTTWAMYLNGERFANTLTLNATGTTAKVAIGYYASAASILGTTDDFRITMGVVRYSDNMVTLDPRRFPRSVGAITPGRQSFMPAYPLTRFAPPAQMRPVFRHNPWQEITPVPPVPTDPGLHLGPIHPLHVAGGLPVSLLQANPGISPFSLTLYRSEDVVLPPGQVSAAAAARQTMTPPFPPGVIVGPWSRFGFVPVRVENHDNLVAPLPPPREFQVPPVSAASIVPGPWNRFGRARSILPGAGQFAPVPVPPTVPPPPPPPQSGVFGPPRTGLTRIPRAPKTTDERVRPHIDRVSDMLNSLLRRGFIVPEGSEFRIVGGGIQLPRAPTAADDMTVGAVVGMSFVDSLHNDVYICTNNSVGSAVWRKIT